MFKFNKWSNNDDWTTPIEYWEKINHLIPNDIIINDPFYMNGKAKEYWKQIGRDIIHEKKKLFHARKK